jgi:hypothetical protein
VRSARAASRFAALDYGTAALLHQDRFLRQFSGITIDSLAPRVIRDPFHSIAIASLELSFQTISSSFIHSYSHLLPRFWFGVRAFSASIAYN